MKQRWLASVVAALCIGVSACHRSPTPAEQLAALDNAFQAGVLTKKEYDAKRNALLPPEPVPVVAAPVAAAPVVEAPVAAAPVSAAPTPAVASPAPAPEPVIEPAPQPAKAKSFDAAPRSAAAEPSPLASCKDAEYRSSGGQGKEERFFPSSPAVVKRAAADALLSLDFTIHRDSDHYLEASKKRHVGALVGAGGEKVTLEFKKAREAGRDGTIVTGETKKSFVGRLAQKSWTSAVLAQTACQLGTSLR